MNNIPEVVWAGKREEIAREFRALGTGYLKTLIDGWVRYLEEKHAGSGGAPIPRRANPASAQRIVLDDYV